MMGLSLGGVLAGAMVFGGATFLVFFSLLLVALIFDLSWLAVGIMTSAIQSAAVGWNLWRDNSQWRVLATGFVVALVAGLFSLCLNQFEWQWFLAVPPVISGLTSLVLLCRQRGGPRARAFLTGSLGAITLLAGLDELLLFQRSMYYIGPPAQFYLVIGLLLVPLLSLFHFLERFWSWDDAFPRAWSRGNERDRYRRTVRRLSRRSSVSSPNFEIPDPTTVS